MKSLAKDLAGLGLFAGVVASAAAPSVAEPTTAPLTLEISSPREGGRIAVAVFRDGGGFPDAEDAVRSAHVRPSGALTRLVIADLPPGRYSVAAFHDADGDGKLTLWPIGLPREAYGFSNDARGAFGPPRFDQAAFDLTPGGAVQRIRLR